MIYIIDNDYYSLLTAVFLAYENKEFNIKVFNEYSQLSFIEKIKYIKTDSAKAVRVETAVKKILKSRYSEVLLAFRSGIYDKNTIIFNYLVEVINTKKDISKMYNNEKVFKFLDIVYKVKWELHHLKGFIRFSKTSDGIYNSSFYPDNNICDLLLPHFIKRYYKMPFILHDYHYDVLCAYNNGEKKIVREKIQPLKLKDSVTKLFKTYYNSVNIESRKNLKLMKNYMPKRYHINMPEKDELL